MRSQRRGELLLLLEICFLSEVSEGLSMREKGGYGGGKGQDVDDLNARRAG